MSTSRQLILSLTAAGMLSLLGCQAQETTTAPSSAPTSASASSSTTSLQNMKQHATAVASKFDRPGFTTIIDDGRLWVFEADSKDLAAFKEHGEPAKLVTRIGAGPNGMTIKSTSSETIDAYTTAKTGFTTIIDDGRLWVFEADSKDLADFKEHGEPAKLVTRIGAGPNGMTIKSTSSETIDAYLAAK